MSCPLPPGWEARRDHTGRLYFVDHNAHETSWVDPRPMPNGWEQKFEPTSRRRYFANHLTKSTQWHDPRPEPVIGVASPMALHNDFKKMMIKQQKNYDHADRDWYRDVLKMAMVDDCLTPDEYSLLAQVRRKLAIDDDEHIRILAGMGLTEEGLKEKRKEETGNNECIVCLDAPATHVILECMHICVCGDCAKTFESLREANRVCPKCRNPITRIQQCYT